MEGNQIATGKVDVSKMYLYVYWTNVAFIFCIFLITSLRMGQIGINVQFGNRASVRVHLKILLHKAIFLATFVAILLRHKLISKEKYFVNERQNASEFYTIQLTYCFSVTLVVSVFGN